MYTQLISPTEETTVRVHLSFQASDKELESNHHQTGASLDVLVKQAMESSFLLVCQPGTTSFIIVAKNSRDPSNSEQSMLPTRSVRRTRFHVVIGPQLCSCYVNTLDSSTKIDFGESKLKTRTDQTCPCIHILFVMLRILNTPLDDRCLGDIPLPAGKAESLVNSYHARKARLMHVKNQTRLYGTLPNLRSANQQITGRWAAPVAIRPVVPDGINKVTPLISSSNTSHQNSPECCELSKLTKNIKPISRYERKDGSDRPSTENSLLVTSRCSSSDSVQSSHLVMPDAGEMDHSVLNMANKARPRTAPQPEPPPRLGRGRTRSIRHACSTIFRPIRDNSPADPIRLPPSLPEESGVIDQVLPHAEPMDNGSVAYGRSLVARQTALRSDDYELTSTFRHVKHSPFKTVGPRDSLKFTAKRGSIETLGKNERCALCLKECPCEISSEKVLTCSSDLTGQCDATFHLSCCRVWLEEVMYDGTGPHCPLCFSKWDSLPMDLRNSALLCESQTSQVHTMENTIVSTCCICQPRSSFDLTPVSTFPVVKQPTTEMNSRQIQVQCKLSNENPAEGIESSRTNEAGPKNDNEGCSSRTAHLQTASMDSNHPYPEYGNCVSAFSLEIADGIASRHSAAIRQQALQQAAQCTVNRILSARQRYQQNMVTTKSQTKETQPVPVNVPPIAELDCLRVMLRLIQYLLDDPVDAVFIDALRAFREILGYLVCFNIETQTALQRAIGPILRRLLRFAGGASVLWSLRDLGSTEAIDPVLLTSNAPQIDTTECHEPRKEGIASVKTGSVKANLRDRANLALATLVELAKGQTGALAIGRDVGYVNRCLPVCGLQHMTRFILSSAKFHATHLIGRLTLLDKLIRMDETLGLQAASAAQISASSTADQITATHDRLARRHLCSSLVFARRHMLPPALNTEAAVCFPHHYQLQGPNHWMEHDRNFDSRSRNTRNDMQQSASDSLYNTQLKASRVARRVFISAAKALLLYGNRLRSGGSAGPTSKRSLSDQLHEFCPREFVEVEIDRNEAPLAAWLRNKLSSVLYPNLCQSSEQTPTTKRMVVSEAPVTLSCADKGTKESPQKLSNSQSVDNMPCSNSDHEARTQSLSPVTAFSNKNEGVFGRQPPTPPPRRNLKVEALQKDTHSSIMPMPTLHSEFVCVALEPAYDLVALSESGQYSSASECEPGMDCKLNELDDVFSGNEPTYGGRSLGSEAELQTEQAAVLRSALRRCSRSSRPLLPVPALSIVMDAFRTTKKLPSADEYYESVDWIRGPILGHGAFSQCYQARDTRTGLLMAVKRIRLGDGAVISVPTEPASKGEHFLRRPLVDDKVHLKGGRDRHPKCSTQLAEVEAEVDIMLRLNHPNVLRLFGAVCCVHRGLVDLFVEWMPGGSVTSLLQQYGAFNESVTLAYGIQVVRGLAYLHKYGILHRDLKGANLLVDTTGSLIRISDFGASARLSGEISVAGQFKGQVIGTFSFMAPEVLRGETYGRACDVWSVGCCLIEMLTGKPPWHDARLTNRYAVMFTIATSDSPPSYPQDLDKDLVELLNACFARRARDRPTASKLLTFRAFTRLTESASRSNNPSDCALLAD